MDSEEEKAAVAQLAVSISEVITGEKLQLGVNALLVCLAECVRQWLSQTGRHIGADVVAALVECLEETVPTTPGSTAAERSEATPKADSC